MFNFDESGKNFLNLDITQTVWLLVSLGIVLVLLVVGLCLYFKKREIFGKFLKYSVISLLLYSIAVIVFNVVASLQEDGQYFQQYQLWITVAIFIVIVVIGILAIVNRKKDTANARAVAMAAICISISFALSYVRLFRLPQGGSITMASVALLALYSYMYGVKRGVLAALIYGVLQSLLDPWVVHPIQYLLDYPLAYVMFGLVGVFKGKFKSTQLEIALGFGIAIFLRYLCHFFSGAIWFGSYGEEFGIINAWAWGAIYNLYVPVDGLIAYIVLSRLVASTQVRGVMLKESDYQAEFSKQS